ncbi:DUF4118 domain-containing protein [Auraticoccus monumenti]|uniref:histidine kinase n=1 Tax=Auraticoccus monumenti TaxID=675864 RepID=A0A1G6RLS1_9ACTN|nr:DUF4118 domain-containing protein [Auraticoccus monumenti]SDD05371.1 two-component system, OmpR family, sensor histidine kinase KdpD [Auraticoccus monumenti]
MTATAGPRSPRDLGRLRGELRVLLGAAPGVGKTYAMLDEGHRRAARGTDVVVAVVETHGRRRTAERLEGLEVVPRRSVEHRGTVLEEMDVDAVLARRPQVALVDELAHTNAPGSRHRRRCGDVEELLAAGISVITTVNVQHLESLNDVVASITGVRQQETVPDSVVRAADQVELVDMAPEALRRRLLHGNVYPPERVEATLSSYFRPGNLAALRELALLWVADRVDAALALYRDEHAIAASWPTRDRVVVALSGGPEGADLVRRGARIAGKGAGGELHAVFVARSDGLVERDPRALAEQRRLVEDLDGSFHTLTGEDPAEAVLDYARSVNATTVVVGQSRRSRWQSLLRAPVSQRIVAGSGDIDCHLVTHRWAGRGQRTVPVPLSLPRRVVAYVLAVVLPVALTALFALTPGWTEHEVPLLTQLAATVLVALVGGLLPAVLAAVVGNLLVNFWLVEPRLSLTVADSRDVLSLLVFLLVGLAVSSVVQAAARRTREAAAARAEADTLLALTRHGLATDASVASLLEQVRDTFSQHRVELRVRDVPTAPWRVEHAVGEEVGAGGPDGQDRPDRPDTELPLDDLSGFALYGRGLTASEQRVLTAFGIQAVVRMERRELAETAAQADTLAARSAFQTALLAAVSHDLRTPLAAIKTGLSGLVDEDVELDPATRRELLLVVQRSAERLERLVANLLDMTRIQMTSPAPELDAVLVDEVVRAAVHALPHVAGRVELARSELLVRTDPGLVERVVANVVDNAVRHQPEGSPVEVRYEADGDRVRVLVVDRGPGISRERREQVFQPFQRLGDRPARAGVPEGLGLGLAVASGFAASVGATLTPTDTPGGGLTMVIDLPAAR